MTHWFLEFGANKILAEEVEMLRDVIARLAEVEHWDEYQAVLSELDGYPLFEGWKR